MPIYNYECKCGKEKEVLGRWSDIVKCPDCKKPMKRLISGKTSIAMGVGAYGYYDDNLGTYINTNAHKKQVMAEQGVQESYGKGWL